MLELALRNIVTKKRKQTNKHRNTTPVVEVYQSFLATQKVLTQLVSSRSAGFQFVSTTVQFDCVTRLTDFRMLTTRLIEPCSKCEKSITATF